MASKEDRQIAWLEHRIDYYGRYHDHKETMAWVATAFYLGGIVYLASYFRTLLERTDDWWKALPSLCVLAAGYLAFCFVKWQFDRRWKAHKNVWCDNLLLRQLILGGVPKQEVNFSRGCRDLWVMLRYILPDRLCGERGKLPQERQPLKSEVITYAAIFLATLAALLLVVLQK